MAALARQTIENDLVAIIRRIQPDYAGEIRETDRLRDDLGLDSLYSMELLSEITEKYGVDIEPEHVQDVRTVGDVVTFLSSVLGG